MGFVLRRPGTTVREPLGDTGITVAYKVPDAQQASEIRRAALMAAKNSDRLDTAMQTIFGLLVESLEGVDLDGETEFAPEKDKAGRLTEESLALLIPVSQPLLNFAMRVIGLAPAEEKNL
jgi:hypothetical protein